MKYFALLLMPFVLFGQYDLVKDVISSGGTKATSANYVLYGTISQTTIGSVAGGAYKGIIGFWQPFDWIAPNPPDVVRAVKSTGNVVLTWNKVSTDVNGNPEIIEYYSVYRNTTPNYIPGTGTFVGNSTGPDTNYTDAGVVGSGTSYYYLVKAVDYGRNLSFPSNMGFKFNKTLNENASLTDKNWTSLPYRNNYPNISDFYTDIALSNCYGIRKLDAVTQLYTTCYWDSDLEMFINDYAAVAGTGYEVLAQVDTVARITGAHDPNLSINLNENASLTDKNWISIPYNTSYANASDAYTDIGISVCYGIRKLDAGTQLYTTCYWDGDLEMFINDYPVVLGIAYEVLVSTDATWTPDVYTNRGADIVSTPVKEHLGTMAVIKDPNWPVVKDEEKVSVISDDLSAVKHSDVSWQPVDRLPYSIRGRIKGESSGLALYCYVLSRPDELLTESVQSCGIRNNNKATVWWAELGNLPTAWRAGDEVVVLLSKEGYYGTARYRLDGTSDMAKLSDITLNAVPEIEIKQSVDGGMELSWQTVDDPLVIGYSVYRISDNQTCERLNDAIIKGTFFTVNNAAIESQYELRLVFAGGWESGFYPRIVDQIADGIQSSGDARIPMAFALGQARPNPFAGQTEISFAVAQARRVELKVYDVAGKLVRTLKNERLEPGYYNVKWDALDNMSRPVGMGVYFYKFVAGDFSATHKIVVAR